MGSEPVSGINVGCTNRSGPDLNVGQGIKSGLNNCGRPKLLRGQPALNQLMVACFDSLACA